MTSEQSLVPVDDDLNTRLIQIMDDASLKFDETKCAALPYLFSGMRPAQVAARLSKLFSQAIDAKLIYDWMRDSDYARLVTQGRSLMRQWNLVKLQQLAVVSYDIIAGELARIPVGFSEEKRQLEVAKFIIRELGKTRPQEVKHSIDMPIMLMTDSSANIIADRIAGVLESGGVDKERNVIAGEYTTIERDDVDSVSQYSNIIPSFGVLNVDWDNRKMQCHACSGWFVDLARHANEIHDIEITEYRTVYGISGDIPLSWKAISEMGFRSDGGLMTLDEEGDLKPYEPTFEEMAEDGREDEETDS